LIGSAATLKTGIKIMAAILQFQNRKKSERPSFEAGHTALILMYTGVRFERIDFEALKSKSNSTLEDQQTATARFAN
jgi:cytoplasmic iron level regulating protein YaaA (DUF328/UPF0246 family)